MSIDSQDYDNLRDLLAQTDAMAGEVARTWDVWKNARSGIEERINETKQFLFATSTRETSGGNKGGLDGEGFDHSVHLPKLTQIADNLAAHYKRSLFGSRDWLMIDSQDKDSAVKAKQQAVLAYLKVKHEAGGFVDVMTQLLDDWILYGNCFAELNYTDERTELEDGEYTQGFVGAKTSRINPLDIVFNLQASNFEKAPKIIRRVHSVGSIARLVEENPNDGWSKPALDKAMEFRHAIGQFNLDDNNKELQQILDGLGNFSDYYNQGYVEILEFYGDFYDTNTNKLLKNHVISVMDRQYVLRSESLDTWSGKPHIFHCGWRNRPDSLWAMSPLENLVGMQFLINHLRNGIADATDLILYPQKFVQGDITEPENQFVPGATWYDPEGDGAVNFLRPDTTFLAADFQIDKLEAQMEAYAGSPRETMGQRTAGEKTAYEVQTLQQAAMGIFQHRITYFETQFLKHVVNAEIELARRFMETSTVKIVDDDTGVEAFLDITREDIDSNGVLVPVGAQHFIERAQRIQEIQGTIQMLAADPEVRVHFSSLDMAKDIEDALGKDPQTLVTPFVRVAEQLQAQQMQNTASRQLESEEMNALEEDFPEEGQGEPPTEAPA